MQRYKIIIEYDGTKFAGWQRQKSALSIQEVLEDSIYKFSGEKISLVGSGRTDAGVHAIGQVAHFDLSRAFQENVICNAINSLNRPHLISVLSCERVGDEFHARFSAKKRTYIYKICTRKAPVALYHNKVYHLPYMLNIDQMREASLLLLGTHDFTSFRAKICQAKSPIKTLSSIDIAEFDDMIHIEISAPSFLHHMVRNLVGTLILVGREKINPEEVGIMLRAKNRSAAGPTAPSCGLYFFKVDY
ncbi:MAG: tRNA pseudouridine(38-40) synthase TruA [Rickettsiaceae bacterium]|nr:tRNA pseudouridine(38-40) synthase TruA [Rickettsiaceae bacterium]